MHRHRTSFRCLVIASFIVGGLYGYGFSHIDFPASWHKPLAPRELGPYMLGPILALINLIAYIGLFFFWRAARVLLAVCVVGAMAPLIEMPQVPAWLESLHRLDLVLQGVLVACLFLPPFSVLFGKAPSNSTVETDAQQAARGSL
jgi:hypothetical protein